MNILSLFDGASCAMVCLKRAGIPIDNYYGADIKKAAVRCEKLIAEYYGVNHIQLGDVTKIDYSTLPHIDLLCAGFPCQDYSVVNSRKQGINGKNGQLFWEVVRAIKAVKPKYIILENVTTIPCQTQQQARLDKIGDTNSGSDTVIGVLNRSRDTIVYSTKEIATLVQNQPTRAGEGVFILTSDPSKTPYKRKKIESVFDAGYTAFRCPTQAELARFHTYPVEIMQQFTPPQAQSLMGDGWHCGSIQWLFDKLKEIIDNENQNNT